jgi:CBS domain-containing protein
MGISGRNWSDSIYGKHEKMSSCTDKPIPERNKSRLLTPNEARYFRDQFRNARAAALADAEGFQQLFFCIERFGTGLTDSVSSLENYKGSIVDFARASALAERVPNKFGNLLTPFPRLYDIVKVARNEALHHGAFARNLTSSAIQLALVLEDALMTNQHTVADYMVRGPVCAEPWQPISLVRQQMLANSYSYLPVLLTEGEVKGWCLISDHFVATYLRKREGDRKKLLAKRLEDAIRESPNKLPEAPTCLTNTTIEGALGIFTSNGLPLLIFDEKHPSQLVGIVTAFDLL